MGSVYMADWGSGMAYASRSTKPLQRIDSVLRGQNSSQGILPAELTASAILRCEAIILIEHDEPTGRSLPALDVPTGRLFRMVRAACSFAGFASEHPCDLGLNGDRRSVASSLSMSL
jgi:hypothetical protein